MSCKSLNFGVLRKINLRGGLNLREFTGLNSHDFKSENLRKFFLNLRGFKSKNLRNLTRQISREISQKFRLNLSDFQSIILSKFKGVNSHEIPTPKPKIPHLEQKWTRL